MDKLSNLVKNDVVKKTDYNAKVTNIEGQIARITKNTIDNLADITKLKAIDTNSFVLKTKLASDANTLENKIDTVDKKIPDITGLATKTSLNSYLQTSIFVRGFFSYEYHSDLVYDCKLNLIKTYSYGILEWKPKNIYLPSNKNVLNSVQNIKLISPNIKNDGKGLHAFFSGNYFQQDIIAIPNNVINIYCVYELDPIDFSRNNEFTIQNALFGAIEITKNANTSKYKYKGYGICFNESESFSHVRKEGNFNHTTLARNVIIFGVGMSFSKHVINKANNIYVMGKDYIQKINDTTIYAEKMFFRNFTDPGNIL